MLELAQVIKDLRAEVESAMAAADGQALLFEVGPIELDVSLAVEAAANGEGRIRFWVVDLGASSSVNRTSTQHLKLTLTPKVGPNRTSPQVSGTADERRQ